MRLGMGFNSYSQQLCCNDSVVKADAIPATETDLVVQPLQADTNQQVSQVVQNGSITQMVTWTAKFVDKISDVTEAMNINGAASVKYGSISGSASGSFLDSSKFKTSDLNFFIQVSVINQKMVAENVTQFNPIKNAQAQDFNKLYGDSFISGFIEGGQFNAVISISLRDEDKDENIKGALNITADFALIQGKIDASGGYDKSSALQNSETTISVTWSGGGNITPPGLKDWDMATLKQIAVAFPAMVAAAPVRTSAVLTKYTSLRSFYEQTVQGSPLDYENAGVYTSALLDAYLEYKAIWTDIQVGQWNVQNLGSTITEKQVPLPAAELAAYAKTLEDHYQSKLAKAKAVPSAGGESIDGFEQVVDLGGVNGNEELNKPNPCVQYAPDLLGLDKARQECRFEMIKIVQEVDAVTANPLVAIEPSRSCNYLSPLIFRMLLPDVIPKPLPPPPEPTPTRSPDTSADEAAKEAAATKSELEATQKDFAAQQAELDDSKKALAASQAELQSSKNDLASKGTELEATKKDLEAARTAATVAATKAAPQAEPVNAGSTQPSGLFGNHTATLPPRPFTKLYVMSISWGGKSITDKSAVDRLYKLGESMKPFVVNNDLFGMDPAKGSVKTAVIAYRFGQGPTVNISVTEGSTVSFKEK
ncbi:hypothetical protein MMC11_001940 [Xylographa trunciseda]|nr:hypothetical protein [Xylographa trunciseda]